MISTCSNTFFWYQENSSFKSFPTPRKSKAVRSQENSGCDQTGKLSPVLAQVFQDFARLHTNVLHICGDMSVKPCISALQLRTYGYAFAWLQPNKYPTVACTVTTANVWAVNNREGWLQAATQKRQRDTIGKVHNSHSSLKLFLFFIKVYTDAATSPLRFPSRVSTRCRPERVKLRFYGPGASTSTYDPKLGCSTSTLTKRLPNPTKAAPRLELSPSERYCVIRPHTVLSGAFSRKTEACSRFSNCNKRCY